MSVTIYGASDDLIEVEGDISEEFSSYSSEDAVLAFSDGTMLSVKYDEHGFWRINRIAIGIANFSKTEGSDLDDDYSDKVTLDGPIKWVVYSDGNYAPRS